MILVVLCLGGLVVHLAVFPFRLEVVITMIGVAIGLGVSFRLFQIWDAVVVFTTGAALFTYLRHRPEAWASLFSRWRSATSSSPRSSRTP